MDQGTSFSIVSNGKIEQAVYGQAMDANRANLHIVEDKDTSMETYEATMVHKSADASNMFPFSFRNVCLYAIIN